MFLNAYRVCYVYDILMSYVIHYYTDAQQQEIYFLNLNTKYLKQKKILESHRCIYVTDITCNSTCSYFIDYCSDYLGLFIRRDMFPGKRVTLPLEPFSTKQL